jgi:hypothetical protein
MGAIFICEYGIPELKRIKHLERSNWITAVSED